MMQVKPRVNRSKMRVQPPGPPQFPDQAFVLVEPTHKHLPDPLTGSKRERIMQHSEKCLRIVGREEIVPPKCAGVCYGVERCAERCRFGRLTLRSYVELPVAGPDIEVIVRQLRGRTTHRP